MLVSLICVCAVQEKSHDDIRVPVGGCEMEQGRAGRTDYGSGGIGVPIGVAAGKSRSVHIRPLLNLHFHKKNVPSK